MGCTESKAKTAPASAQPVPNPVAPLGRRAGTRSAVYDDDDRSVVYRGPSRHTRTASTEGDGFAANRSQGAGSSGSVKVSVSGSDVSTSSSQVVRAPFGDGGPKHIVLQPSEVLGRGGYGVVYKAYIKSTKTPLAVKECTFDESNVAMVNALRAEFEVLSQLDHPHIVRVHHFAIENNRVARVFMELMPQGSVRTLMKQLSGGGGLTETSARRIIHQALLGLAYLHGRGLLHRDVKPDNMLVAANGVVKLSDFGTTKATLHAASGTTTMVVGTVMYMAPETISGKYSAASDIWAVAASFLELVTGKPPWHETGITQSIALLFHIGNVRNGKHHHPLIPHFLSAEGRRVLAMCFHHDPRRRPSATQLLAEPYFRFDDFAGHDDDHDDPVTPLAARSRTPSEYVDENGMYLGDDGSDGGLDEESLGSTGSFASVEE